MAAGFERMRQSFPSIIEKLFEAGIWVRRPVRVFTGTKRIKKVSPESFQTPISIGTSLKCSQKPDPLLMSRSSIA